MRLVSHRQGRRPSAPKTPSTRSSTSCAGGRPSALILAAAAATAVPFRLRLDRCLPGRFLRWPGHVYV